MSNEKPLTEAELVALAATFPELSWIKPADWQSVATFADWRRWIDEADEWRESPDALAKLLTKRRWRIEIRTDCPAYYGQANVENINDPTDKRWA